MCSCALPEKVALSPLVFLRITGKIQETGIVCIEWCAECLSLFVRDSVALGGHHRVGFTQLLDDLLRTVLPAFHRESPCPTGSGCSHNTWITFRGAFHATALLAHRLWTRKNLLNNNDWVRCKERMAAVGYVALRWLEGRLCVNLDWKDADRNGRIWLSAVRTS